MLSACRHESSGGSSRSERTLSSATVAASVNAARAKPEQLLTLPISAYHPTLTVADDAIYLLTEHAAFRVTPGAAPESFNLELGLGAALTNNEIVYFSGGSVFLAPKRGGTPERVVDLPRRPQFYVADGDRFAWLDHAEDGHFAIQTLSAGKVRTLLAPQGQVVALTLLGEWAFFVEASDSSSFRIGGVREENHPLYTPVHVGRPPSMLTHAHDLLYYYDGPRSQITELTPDLAHERAWVSGVICSPIAVSNAAYCGSVEGVYAVSEQSPKPHMLEENRGSMIATISASESRVAWLRDAGPDRLALETLPLTR